MNYPILTAFQVIEYVLLSNETWNSRHPVLQPPSLLLLKNRLQFPKQTSLGIYDVIMELQDITSNNYNISKYLLCKRVFFCFGFGRLP